MGVFREAARFVGILFYPMFRGSPNGLITSACLQVGSSVNKPGLNKQVEELENELKAIRHESSESLQELRELRRCLEHFAPPKRFFRVTLGFFLFFLLSQIFGFALGLRIVDPFWANTGVVITALILVVIYFAKNEIDERLNRKNIQ